jgi:hypothetical protein
MNPSSSERVKRCINLGITDQRCDQYEMVNIVRNIKPSLISLATATRELDANSLKLLADVILYAERNYICKFRTKCKEDNEWIDALYSEFANQLGIENDADIKDFRIAGLALMLSDDLNPHVDGMNPKGFHDLTIQFNFQVDIHDLDPECRKLILSTFGESVRTLPFTLILYPRRCLLNYGKKMKAIKDFPTKCLKERKGRAKMVEVLNDVGSTLDYNTRCMTSIGYSRRIGEMFDANISAEFISAKAAVDKMVSYHFGLLLHLPE